MSEHKEDIIKIIVSAVLFAAALIINGIFSLPWWGSVLIFAVPYLIVGFEVLKEAAENLIHGEFFDECFLMGIATIGAFAVGEYPEAVFVMLFFGVGELFEHIASHKSRNSISALMNIRPDTATLLTESGEKVIKPEEAYKDDIIIVKPGERIPLDGVITEGETAVDTSALTGEAIPAEIGVGDNVLSGCVNLSGVIKIRVSSPYAESTVSKILKLIELSAEKKTRTERFIRRFSKVYTPAVVISALLLAIVPSLITGQWSMWVYRALMFLVVSCPCALVVSVPLTYFSGIGCASRNGILIKGADSLEALSSVKTAVFDKTGTLTKGSFEIVGIYPEKTDENTLLQIAAIAESGSNHPIAQTLKNSCKDIPKELTAKSVTEYSGRGVSADIGGKQVLVGNDKLMNEHNIKYTSCESIGTVIHVAVQGEYLGHIVIADTLKPDSAFAVEQLNSAGITTVMLTGDRTAAAKSIAEKTGITNFRAELLPADKVSAIEEIILKNSDGKTAFVGDGINDAPVLARADIGIAMGALGSDAAIEAADVVITDDSLSKLPKAIKISKRTNAIVKQNITFAIAFKLAVLLLSAIGVSNMWFAAFADVGVMVLAVLNSMRAMKIK